MRIVFLSFGGGSENYTEAVNRICEQAGEFKVFDKIYKFTHVELAKIRKFWKPHKKFVEANKRGYGYWLWKPFLISHVLTELTDGDILFYADAGCELNIRGRQRLLEYIDITRREGFLAFQMDHNLEKKWTRGDLFHFLGCDETVKNSGQCIATAMFIQKSAKSVNFIEEWYRLMCKNEYQFITDGKSQIENDREFVENRHDQSCFSCLAKKYNIFRLPDETFFHPDWFSRGIQYPIWALRNNKGTSYLKISLKLL